MNNKKNLSQVDGKRVEDEANNAKGILTKLFRKILFDTGLDRSIMYFVDKYKAEGGDRSKTSIVKVITSPSMTWDYFVFLIFDILRAKKMRIKIELEWPNGDVTEHEIEVDPIRAKPKERKDNRGRKPKYDQETISKMLGSPENNEAPKKEIKPEEILGDNSDVKEE